VTAVPPTPGRRPTNRRLRVVVSLLLTGLAGFGGWKLASHLAHGPTLAPAAAARDDLTFRSQRPQAHAALQAMLTQPASADPLRLNPAHQPLDAEPAGLPPMPGPGVRHESRYRLTSGAMVDDVSFWRLAGDANAVLMHYRDAATRLGFVELPRPAAPLHPTHTKKPGQSLVFVDPNNDLRVLTLRLAPLDHQQHLTLWLRHAPTIP